MNRFRIIILLSILLSSTYSIAQTSLKKIRGTMLFVNEKSQGFKINDNIDTKISIKSNESLTIFFSDGSYKIIKGPFYGSIKADLKNSAKENSFINRVSGLFAKVVVNNKTIGAVREDSKNPMILLEKLKNNEIGFADNGKYELSLKTQCIIKDKKTKLWDLDGNQTDEINIEFDTKNQIVNLITAEPRYYIPTNFVEKNGNLKITKQNQMPINIKLIVLSEEEFSKQSVQDFLQKDCQLQAYIKAMGEIIAH